MTLTQLFKNLIGVALGGLSQVQENVNALGSVSGNQSIDLSLGNVVTATVAGSGTWTIINPAASGKCSTVTFILTNAGTQITWATVPKWAGGAPPVLSAAGVDIVILTTVDGGTTWYGSTVLALA